MTEVAKKAVDGKVGDGKAEYRVKQGKFHEGRGKGKVVKVPGDIVRLTPLQAKSFADMMEKVSKE